MFMDKVKQFKNDLQLGKLQLKFDIFSFLKNWLMNHIVASDKQYTKYFKENKIMDFFK